MLAALGSSVSSGIAQVTKDTHKARLRMPRPQVS